MIINYDNSPCVIKYKDTFFKLERPKNFFNKHREMNDEDVEFYYIDRTITGMKEVALALQKLEDSLAGVVREKPKQDCLRECPYKYRINRNTVLEAYSKEDLDKLKKWWNIL